MISRRTFLITPLALRAAARRPNVVLLVAGQWRAQATPWAGDPDLVAPNLEKFGKQSVVFPRAYSCYPRATPAHAALLTGRFPHTTGVIKDGAPLPPAEVTMGAVLKSAGYRVASQPPSLAMDFVEKSRDGPFFLLVPLDAPGSSKPYDPRLLHPRANVPPDAERKARQDLANRYGVYSALDQTIGRLLAALDGLGLDDTIVVFTSHHGEQIGSQGLDGDDVAFEESVRVPLAVRYPRALPASTRDLLISQVDLMPTLVALCGEPPPEGVQGRDLSALLSGQKSERPESVYAEGKIAQKDEWRMLVLGFDKIVVNSQAEVTHLYNLADDPYELTNLAHNPALQLKRDVLLAELRASIRKLGDFKRRP